MDGVPAVSQCPIAPFSNFTYNIPAQLYGSSWYHAHYSAQYTGGVVGPIIVYGPSQSDFDLDVGPVMLSDWYHVPYFDVVSDAVGTDMSEIPPISDSLLINGRGRFDCSQPTFDKDPDWLASHVSTDTEPICVDGADLARFKFVPGKTHKLRLVNIGANGIQKFSIDNHKLTVVAYDYVPVNPHTLDIVTLSVGQRADVLVTADQTHAQAFWMRTYAPGGESCGGSAQMEIQAAIFYDGADATTMPTTHRTTYDTLCADLPLDTTSPEYVITPTPLADALHMDLDITLVQNTTGNFEWRMNDQTFRANFNQPALYLAAAGNVSYPYDPQWNMYDVGAAPAVVVNVTNKTPFAHPYHLHGHNYYVLSIGGGGSGDGEGDDGTGAVVWDGDVVNPSNPMRRDIATIPANGYLALMFENDNPGVWPFHCHIAWHLSGGLAVNFITRAAEIPPIPAGMKEQTCDAWEFYSHNNVVDQIDAGS
jgi:FtsP/CotA-like multicopper oxidase with cupredoxin domain